LSGFSLGIVRIRDISSSNSELIGLVTFEVEINLIGLFKVGRN